MIRKFVIYYNNGDVVYGGGEDDELVPVYFSRKWLEAPADGVCHIVTQVEDRGHIIANVSKQEDYYMQYPAGNHGDGYIAATSDIGAYLREALDNGSFVKFGGWTSAENYRRIADTAPNDPYLKPDKQ